ncbi:hypothetical protein B296_00007740 [Ensete ventricosum]|uniref:Uncharacterized protein n=1 Tax=Ensete ventricosum TaxID=4639 RepID=A0A427AXC1_ENSVE|nr:hypothetical protein B296_00007740 [Ensete ventricosum]
MAVGFGCWLAVASAGLRRRRRGVSGRDLEPWIPSDPQIRETSAGWFFSTAPSRSSPTLVKLFHSLEQTSAGAVALTDIVFWGLLVPFLSVEHFKLDLVRALYLYNISKKNLLPGLVSF